MGAHEPVKSASSRSISLVDEQRVQCVDSSAREPFIEVVRDAFSYIANFFVKPKEAKWVRGLENDAPVRSTDEALIDFQSRKAQEGIKFDEKGAFLPLPQSWLYYPNAVGIWFVAATIRLLWQMLRDTSSITYDELYGFTPTSWGSLGPQLKSKEEGYFTFLCRILPFLLPMPLTIGAVYAFSLALRVALTAHQFLPFCGVGVALLYVVAVAAQYFFMATRLSLLSRVTGEVYDEEIEGKAISLLVEAAAMIKLAAPTLTVLLVYPTVSLAMKKRWYAPLNFVLSIPLMALVAMTASSAGLISISFLSQPLWLIITAISWGVFIITCVQQTSYELRVRFPEDELDKGCLLE